MYPELAKLICTILKSNTSSINLYSGNMYATPLLVEEDSIRAIIENGLILPRMDETTIDMVLADCLYHVDCYKTVMDILQRIVAKYTIISFDPTCTGDLTVKNISALTGVPRDTLVKELANRHEILSSFQLNIVMYPPSVMSNSIYPVSPITAVGPSNNAITTIEMATILQREIGNKIRLCNYSELGSGGHCFVHFYGEIAAMEIMAAYVVCGQMPPCYFMDRYSIAHVIDFAETSKILALLCLYAATKYVKQMQDRYLVMYEEASGLLKKIHGPKHNDIVAETSEDYAAAEFHALISALQFNGMPLPALPNILL